MLWKPLILFLVLIALALPLIPKAHANPFYLTNPQYFSSLSGSYIYFPSSVLPQNFGDWYYDGQKNWFNDTIWLTTTKTMTIAAWFTSNWLNYTVTATGTQQIHNGSEPTSVFIDGIEEPEGTGWTYSSGTITITLATTEADIYYGTISSEIPILPTSQGLGTTNFDVAGSNFNIYFLASQSLAFQYFNNSLTMNVINGTLNGTNCKISFTSTGGQLDWTNNANTNVTISNILGGYYIWYNGSDNTKIGYSIASTVKFLPHTTYSIEWNWANISIPFANDLITFMGIGGLIAFFVAPTYGFLQVKNRKFDLKTLEIVIVVMALGFGLMMGWLMS